MAGEARIRITARDDTSPAFRTAQANMAQLKSDAVRLAATLGAGIAIGGIATLITSTIDAADELGKLSQRTGIAVETLGGLGYAASLAGGNVETMSAAADKLNESLAKAASGEKRYSEAFQALGISAVDAAGKTKSVDVAMQEIADSFQKFADGPEKSAIAIRLMSEAGAKQIPLLNQGGQALRDQIAYYQRFSGVTAELTQRSEVFNDTLSAIGLATSSLGTTMASALLPSLQAVADELLRVKEEGSGFQVVGDVVRIAFETVSISAANVVFVLKSIGREIGALAAQAVALGTLDIKGFNAISQAVKEDATRARAELDALERRILGIGSISPDDQSAAETNRLGLGRTIGKVSAPRLPTVSAKVGGVGSKQTQEITEAQRALERYVDALQGVLDKNEELSETEKALNFLRYQGAQGQIPQVRALVLGLARQADETKRLRGEQEALLQLDKALADADQAALQARDDRIKGLVDATPTAQLERGRADIQLLTEEFEKFIATAGRAGISEATYLEAVSARLGITAKEVEKTRSLVEELGLSFQSAFEDAIVGGKSLQDVLKGIGQDLLRITVRKSITEPLGKMFAANFGSLFSFDGGGYTGAGARSGGVDGRGGFLSVLHPQETVIDHSKGQGGGGGTVINNFTVGDVASMNTVRKAIAHSQRSGAVALQRSRTYGGAFA